MANGSNSIQSSTAQTGGVGGSPTTTNVSVNVPVSIPGITDLATGIQSAATNIGTIASAFKSFSDFFASLNKAAAVIDWLGWGVAALGIILILLAIAPGAPSERKESSAARQAVGSAAKAGAKKGASAAAKWAATAAVAA